MLYLTSAVHTARSYQCKVNKPFAHHRQMEEEYIDVRNTQETYERSLTSFKAEESIGERNKEIVLRFLRDAALGKTIIGRGA